MNYSLQHRHLCRAATSSARLLLRCSDGRRLPSSLGSFAPQISAARRRCFSHGSSSREDDKGRESTSSSSVPKSRTHQEDQPQQQRLASKNKPDLSGVKHQVEHRASETIGIRLTERVVERVAEAAEHAAERAAVSKVATTIAERAAAKALAEQAAARAAKRAGSTAAAKVAAASRGMASRGVMVSLPARTAISRLGRGCLIALPLVGAGFAAWIGRSDYRRTRQELELARARLAAAEKKRDDGDAAASAAVAAGKNAGRVAPAASRPTLDTSTVRCFGVATASDSVNFVAHVVSAYALYQGWAPDDIFNVEIASLVSAVVSTGGAVRGEYLVAHRNAAAALGAQEDGHGGSGDAGDAGDGGGCHGSPSGSNSSRVRGGDRGGSCTQEERRGY